MYFSGLCDIGSICQLFRICHLLRFLFLFEIFAFVSDFVDY